MSDSPSEIIAKGIEHVRKKVYHEQPDLMSAFLDLLDLLEVAHCEHEWESKPMGGDPASEDSTEMVTVCKKCGYEDDSD